MNAMTEELGKAHWANSIYGHVAQRGGGIQ